MSELLSRSETEHSQALSVSRGGSGRADVLPADCLDARRRSPRRESRLSLARREPPRPRFRARSLRSRRRHPAKPRDSGQFLAMQRMNPQLQAPRALDPKTGPAPPATNHPLRARAQRGRRDAQRAQRRPLGAALATEQAAQAWLAALRTKGALQARAAWPHARWPELRVARGRVRCSCAPLAVRARTLPDLQSPGGRAR